MGGAGAVAGGTIFLEMKEALACLRSLDFPVRKRVGARTGVGEGFKYINCIICYFFEFHFRIMTDEISVKKIDELIKNQNRSQLLAFLGIDDLPEQIGDNEWLRSVQWQLRQSKDLQSIKMMCRSWKKSTADAVQVRLSSATENYQWAFHVSHII